MTQSNSGFWLFPQLLLNTWAGAVACQPLFIWPPHRDGLRQTFAERDQSSTGPAQVTPGLGPQRSQGCSSSGWVSVVGRIALVGGGYCPSKYGVEAFSDSLRREMRPFGVQISIIEPGGFQTGMTDPRVLVKAMERLWERLPAETQAAYGPRYLETCDSRLSIVTGCMEHALLARCPRSRYTAGWDARLAFLPLSYCPAWLSDTIITFFLPCPAGGIPARP
uniref:Uncharacterized protein n=1 Tax=Anser cygnoides TaxID=8845 RepID=A0A8B9DMS5_ANSCY